VWNLWPACNLNLDPFWEETVFREQCFNRCSSQHEKQKLCTVFDIVWSCRWESLFEKNVRLLSTFVGCVDLVSFFEGLLEYAISRKGSTVGSHYLRGLPQGAARGAKGFIEFICLLENLSWLFSFDNRVFGLRLGCRSYHSLFWIQRFTDENRAFFEGILQSILTGGKTIPRVCLR
jgi:hypothetical protein